MIAITKYKDNSFIISNGNKLMCAETVAELLAMVKWNYGIDRKLVLDGLSLLNQRQDDILELGKYSIQKTSKINYQELFRR